MSGRLVTAWAAAQSQRELMTLSYQSPPLKPMDVEIQVTHCGLCSSDLHLIDGHWGDASVYPQVCGHEVIGRISAVGENVAGLRLGQRVGVGWYRSACLACEFCLRGEEQHCPCLIATCTHGERGGLADYMYCDRRFVFPIPDELSSEHAAPLLCAGVTVYTALKRATWPGMAVGIVGIGGLGHLAVQFAAKRGCRVTALSSSAHKQRDALTLGANRFVDLSQSVECHQVNNALDYILVTSAVACDWSAIVAMLRPHGVLCFAGMPPPVTFDIAAMMYKTLSITTANVGGRQDILDTLAFAAARQVRPWVQSWPLEDVNHAIRQLRKGRVSYRAVMHVPDEQVQRL
jgi:uncharacterized zinc-type alcohol dehydrogenase-like protein